MTVYVKCPQCRGSRFVSACVEPGNGFTPSRWSEFPCPLCSQTGECSEADAAEFRAEQAERD